MDANNELAVYDETTAGELAQPIESVTARNAPAIVKAAGKGAEVGSDNYRNRKSG